MVAMSKKQEGIQQDCQADLRTGGHEASHQDFHWVMGTEWWDIVEGSAPSEKKEGTTSSSRARDVGTSTTLFAHTYHKGTLDRGWWWYTWTGSHLIRELLGKSSGLKAGAVGEQSLWGMNRRERRWDRLHMSQTQSSGKEEGAVHL
jgi:hypothetical protein